MFIYVFIMIAKNKTELGGAEAEPPDERVKKKKSNSKVDEASATPHSLVDGSLPSLWCFCDTSRVLLLPRPPHAVLGGTT